MGLPPSGRVGVVAGDQVARDRGPVAVPRPGSAGRAEPDRAAGVLDGAFGVAGALADADQGEPDPGLGDDLDQPTVRFGLRWARSPLVAGHVAGNSFGRVARRSLNWDRDSAQSSAIASGV